MSLKNSIRKWQHKQTKKTFKVIPWWEIPDPLFDKKNLPEYLEERDWKIGCLVQVGWLIMNDNGIYFGVGLKAEEAFNDIGIWKSTKRKRVKKKK